jgi:Rieske Fe-S protein
MTQEPQQDQRVTRRGVLLGVGVAGVGALAGCSTAAVPYDANLAGQAPGSATAPSASSGAMSGSPASSGSAGAMSGGSGGASGSAAGSGGMSNGTLLGNVSEIPVGGGKVFTAEKVVVTQPVKGEFKAFSAVCTHVGCIVDKVANGEIFCPCHGSIFKTTNGGVVAGPASGPLPAKQINVTGGKILLE